MVLVVLLLLLMELLLVELLLELLRRLLCGMVLCGVRSVALVLFLVVLLTSRMLLLCLV